METELLKGLEAALAEAEAEYAALAQAIPQLESTKSKPKSTKKDAQTPPPAAKTTFGVSKRPEPKAKPGLNAVPLLPNIEPTKKRITGGALPTSSKESKTVRRDSPQLPLSPNYEFTLKKQPAAVIRPPVVVKRPKIKAESTVPVAVPTPVTAKALVESSDITHISAQKPVKVVGFKLDPNSVRSSAKRRYDSYDIDESLNSVSTATSEYEDFFKAKSEWDQTAKEWSSSHPSTDTQKLHFQATPVPAKTALGPGAYTANYSQVEKAAPGPRFPTASRESKPADPPQAPLTPNYEAVKWRKPAAVMVAPTDPPEELQRKRREQEEDDRFAALLQLTTPVGPKDALRGKVVGGAIDRYEENREKPDPEAKLGPGRYFVSYSGVEEAIPGAVKYYIPVSDLVQRPGENRPGPGDYYPDDMATRAEPREAVIGKEVRRKSLEIDRRRALDVNDDLVHPQVPQPHIDPEHISILPPDFSKRLGPGEYSPSHKLTEIRTSLGVPIFIPDVSKPDPIDNRVLLYPDVDTQHPNHLVFQYHEPVVVQPPHVPEKDLFPEKWLFYDANVDNRFDRPPEFDFARGVAQGEYLSEEERKAVELAHYARAKGLKPVPAVGAYDPEPVLDRAPAYDFGKAADRDLDREVDREGEPEEGDVLVLNPTVKEHVPVMVDMKRDVGRLDGSVSLDREELIIEPNIDAVRPKVAVLVNMQRETGRKEKEIDADEGQGLILDPKPVEPKAVVLVNMAKQVGRSVDQSQTDDDLYVKIGDMGGVLVSGGGGSENLLEADDRAVRPKAPMLVNMARQTGRELDQSEQSLEVIPEPVMIVDPTKPRVLGVLPFDRTTGRKDEDREDSGEDMLASHPDVVPEVMKSYKSTLPEVRVATFDRYAARWDEEEEREESKKVTKYS